MTFSFTSKKSHHTDAEASSKNGASAMRETGAETGGAFKGLKTWIAVSVTLVALLGVLGSSASSASANSVWWHLTAGSRPTYMHAGAAKPEVPAIPGAPEVQEIVAPLIVTPGLEEFGKNAGFALEVKKGQGTEDLGNFITEPIAVLLEEEGTKLLDAANLQAALEGPYGKGVHVTEEVFSEEKLVFHVESPYGSSPIELGVYVVEPEPKVPDGTVKETSSGTAGTPATPRIADGELVVNAENLGNADTSIGNPAVFKDTIPAGLEATGVAGSKANKEGDFQRREAIPCSLGEEGGRQVATCTLEALAADEALAPYDQIEMRIGVEVKGAQSEEPNEATITGGGGPPAQVSHPITISSEPVPFGVEKYEMALEEEGGEATVQAGKHPFQLNTVLNLNQLNELNPLGLELPEVSPPALAKDLNFNLPAGLIGNPNDIPKCTITQFFETTATDENRCPEDTAVGVATITIHEPIITGTDVLTEPVFNMETQQGEPARFGFYVVIANTPVFLDTSLRTGSDYGVTVNVHNITQTAAFLANEVTFWGVPGAASHDLQRGWGCLYDARNIPSEQACTASGEAHPKPFLVTPTQCTQGLSTNLTGDSWSEPANLREFGGEFSPSAPLKGCGRLQFPPEIKVAADGEQASKPTGITVDVHVPQEVNDNAEGYASSNVKNITVQFPEGVVVNPAAADGLEACSESQIGLQPGRGLQNELLFSPVLPEPFCPDSSKIGTVTIKSPLLPPGQYVEGALYLADPAPNAEPGQNPFNSLIATYIVARDPESGVLVKLPGSVALDPNTGRIVATFENNPQLAFEDAEIHLFGGERAPFATPSHCGTYTTNATFTPWSGTAAVSSSSSFNITSGPGGGACPPAALPFSPTLAAGTTSNNAGAFSALTTTISREDGNQNIKTVQLHMPPGLSGILKGVPLCAEAQANAGTCGQASLIGHTVVSVGLGGDPFSVTGGEVFLTEKIAGSPGEDPFGLSIVNPAVAGPFNLGKVIVRATIEVDPHTAQLTVTTGEIPHILDGIPLQIKHVNVTIDRAGFTFNPTNCAAQQITGTIGAVEGASAPVSTAFQATNCANLKFAPKFTVTTKGKNSKAGGATLTAKLSEPAGAQGTQANITRVKVDLPKQLPSRLTTLQKACTSAQFELNPANCPKESKIGYAKVTTPLLPVPLEGPAIFVSHGNESFPSLTMVLQGYGVTIDLVGTTFISSKGITSTTFKTVPDVPFNAFTLTLPQGKFSALAANVPTKAHYSLCGQTLAMPTEFLAQNGAKINESTKVSVTGCKKAKKKTKKKTKKQTKSHKGAK